LSTNNPAGVSVALYLCSPRLGRGFSASGRVEHAAEVLPDKVASAAKRGEASPLASPTMAAREACETGKDQQARCSGCCALPLLSTVGPWLQRLRTRRARRGGASRQGGIGGEARGSVSPRLSNDGSKREACETSNDQQARCSGCCALPLLSTAEPAAAP
jgi:hypothetical protein